MTTNAAGNKMTMIRLNGLVSFGTNFGVLVHEKALSVSPDELFETVALAFSHLNDPPLVQACCGGSGPLASYLQLEYEEYLKILDEIAIVEAGATAKRKLTLQRRTEFNTRRADLILSMIDAGVPYVCAHETCEIRDDLTVDHIKALSRGGTDDLSNLRFMCRGHNSAKGARDDNPSSHD